MSDGQKNLKDLQKFFELDFFIKNALSEIEPTASDIYNRDARVEYGDRAYESIKEIKNAFSRILSSFDIDDEFKQIVLDKIDEIEGKFFEGVYKLNLKKVYLDYFANMNEKIVEKTKETCVGYTMGSTSSIVPLVNQCKTYNELLHVIHSYIMNNEEILRSLPVIATKEISYGNSINLYGIESKMAKQIFEAFQSDTPVGETTIVSLSDEQTIMMVRDMGHALTLNITTEDGYTYVDYFVPKICNPKKVNELRGVIKVKEDAKANSFTNGSFRIRSKGELGQEVVQFIESVPTDLDMDMGIDEEHEISNTNYYDTLKNQEPCFQDSDYQEIVEEQKASEMGEFLKSLKGKLFGGKEDDIISR